MGFECHQDKDRIYNCELHEIKVNSLWRMNLTFKKLNTKNANITKKQKKNSWFRSTGNLCIEIKNTYTLSLRM